MAHIVDTSVAAVKMSGSFAAVEFSSSDEEGDQTMSRPRSNAVLEASPSSSGLLRGSDALHGLPSDSVKQRQQSERSPYSTTGHSIETVQQADPDSRQTSSTLVSSHSHNTLQSSSSNERTYRDSDQDSHGSDVVESNANSRNNHQQHSHSDLSSPEFVSHSSLSSPVMMKRAGGGGANGAVSSASTTTTSSGSSCSRDAYYQSRFNPFDRDMHIDEDHFSDNLDSNLFGRSNTSSKSAISSQWGDHWNEGPMMGQDSDIVTNAELGLAEDHFSHPEGPFGMSHAEELELAIDNCKVLIMKAVPNSERHKNLVRKLVELRLKLQEMKDEPVVKEENVLTVLGHRLMRKESRSSKYYCEKCNSLIWGLVQEWRKCLDCGYRCHDKCVPQLTRNCAMVKVKEKPVFIMEICPRNPRGLSAQDFRCAECRMKIPVADGVEPRLCEYNGKYYCELCHWNDLMYSPAEILHNWDFEKRRVCRSSKQFLKLMMKKAVINVEEINPSLFTYVDQLNDIKTLREELLMMKKYILACPTAMQHKLLLQLSSRPHFVECSNRYSLQDLIDSDEALVPELVQVHSTWAQHIKTECQVCQGRGFLCELCTNKEVLFPFDNIAVVCPSCSAVMHRICFAQQVMCPKCERRRKRRGEQDKRKTEA